jgi:hypothetical protein
MKSDIALPRAVVRLWKAREHLYEHYDRKLAFTLDGKLVGDIGEAVAAEAFGLELCGNRRPGVDALARDGRTVQIKATGLANGGPAFSPGEATAKHLLFLRIDFPKGTATVVYNGPEAPIRALLSRNGKGTRSALLSQVKEQAKKVRAKDRLRRV